MMPFQLLFNQNIILSFVIKQKEIAFICHQHMFQYNKSIRQTLGNMKILLSKQNQVRIVDQKPFLRQFKKNYENIVGEELSNSVNYRLDQGAYYEKRDRNDCKQNEKRQSMVIPVRAGKIHTVQQGYSSIPLKLNHYFPPKLECSEAQYKTSAQNSPKLYNLESNSETQKNPSVAEESPLIRDYSKSKRCNKKKLSLTKEISEWKYSNDKNNKIIEKYNNKSYTKPAGVPLPKDQNSKKFFFNVSPVKLNSSLIRPIQYHKCLSNLNLQQKYDSLYLKKTMAMSQTIGYDKYGSSTFRQLRSSQLVSQLHQQQSDVSKMNQTDPQNCFSMINTLKTTKTMKTMKTMEMMKGMETMKMTKEMGINPKKLSIDDFVLVKCKGQGRFGKVYLAQHIDTKFICAIKQVKRTSIKYMQDQFIEQLKIQLFLNHSNIVKMYGFFLDEQSIYIIMEFMEQGSLFTKIKITTKIQEQDAAIELKEICLAVQNLHEFGIIHRDIKPENIVISNGVYKLCDFGWAAYTNGRRKTYCGTLDYVCPEILQGEQYDNCVDIWSIGVLAYEMMTGKAPFYNISRKQTMKKILSCEFLIPKQLSRQAGKFIEKAIKKNPVDRITIQELLRDPFLRN